MLRPLLSAAIAALAVLTQTGDAGADTERTGNTVRLIESGKWIVEQHDLGGTDLVCTLYSISEGGQTLGFTYMRGVGLYLQLTYDRSLFPVLFPGASESSLYPRTDLRLDVDYEQYLFDARQMQAGMMQVDFPPRVGSDNAVFTTDMAVSNAIALKDPEGDRTLHVWSLAGSGRAVETWRACLRDIDTRTVEPSVPGVSEEMSRALGDYFRRRQEYYDYSD